VLTERQITTLSPSTIAIAASEREPMVPLAEGHHVLGSHHLLLSLSEPAGHLSPSLDTLLRTVKISINFYINLIQKENF
jgi:hypothetical protein